MKCSSAIRCHHLLKTFYSGPGGWRDRQSPDATVVWTTPSGQTHTTRPGSHLLFPELCTPTAPVPTTTTTRSHHSPNTGLTMPRRSTTRAAARAQRITAERHLNQTDPQRQPIDTTPPF